MPRYQRRHAQPRRSRTTAAVLVLCNEEESEKIQRFRAGQENANGQTAKWDFIGASNQPAFIIEGGGQLVGKQPPGEVFKLPSVGSYGPCSIVESSYIPAGYFTLVATSGPGSPSNVVGVREHSNAQYRGLRQIPGRDQRHPLVESYYTRAFGTGVRFRGGAICYQLKSGGSYEVPEIAK